MATDPHPADVVLVPDPDASTEALLHTMTHRRFLGEYADEGPARAARAAARAWGERVLPQARCLTVRAGDRDRGHVWLTPQDDDLAVLTLVLDDAALAAGVRDRLLATAVEEGRRRLTVGIAPGDPVLEAFAAGGGFEVVATQMRLDLAHRLPAEDPDTGVRLVPMDEAAYAVWEHAEIESYAAARERSGETRATALRTSRDQHAELLPDGLASADHHFFVGVAGGEEVGTLWIGTGRPMHFVYDVAVHEEHRRRGHGAGLMRAGALWSQEQGSHLLGLNVFGYNHGARALYDRLGYHVVEEYAARPVGP